MTRVGIAARPREYLITAILACALAVGCIMVGETKIAYQVALFVGVTGVIALATVPNPRVVLVILWVFLHPLSIEKVFPIGPPPHPNFPPPTIVVSASDIALFLLVGRIFFEWFVHRKRPCNWPTAATPYLALCCWVVAMFFTAPSIGGILQIMHWWKMLAFLLVLPAAIRTRYELYLVLAAVGIAVAAQSAVVWTSWRLHKPISFITLFSPSSLPLIGFSSGGDSGLHIRASGTFGQVNQQAGLHVFFTLPLLGLVFVRNSLWRSITVVVIMMSMSAILITFSRTAWLAGIGAFCAIIACAILAKRMTRRTWLMLGLCAGVSLCVLGVFIGPVTDRIFKGDEGASSSRLRMVMTSFQLSARHPLLGTGPGNFVEAILEGRDLNLQAPTWLAPGQPRVYGAIEGIESYNGVVNGKQIIVPLQVHNKFLLVLVELGIVGLLLFVWYQWKLIRTAWACLRVSDPSLFWAAAGLLGATVATQIYFMLELAYDDKSVLILIWANALLLTLHQIILRERCERSEVAP